MSWGKRTFSDRLPDSYWKLWSQISVLLAGLLWTASVWAIDTAYPLVDPLHTRPDILNTGVTLPGDGAPVPCPAQKVFPMPLTLGEAVDLALCNNPQIRSSWANIKIQAGMLGEARAPYLPSITGSLGRTNDQIRHSESGSTATNVDKNTAQVTLTWRLLDFGGRTANHQAAEDLLTAALASHDATLQKTLSEVIQAYFDALTTRAAFKAKTENVDIATDTLHSARMREEKGTTAQTDTLQATTALAKANLEKNRAHGGYEKALSVLRYILGVPGNPTISLPENLDEKAGENGGKALAIWLEEAEKLHPALLAARSQLTAAQLQVEATRSAGLPSLGISASYYQNTRPGEAVTYTNTKETTVGLILTVPIFNGFSSTYKLRGAQAQVEQREAVLADTQHQITMEVIKVYADATSALQNIEASAILLGASQKALASSQRRYIKGAADIVELLNTQAALADAREERIRCLAEWRSARLRLLASAGQLGRAAAVE